MTTVAKKSAKPYCATTKAKVRPQGTIRVSTPSGVGKKTAAPKSFRTVTFGSVTIEGPAPTEAETKLNVKAGQTALARAMKALVTTGVKLELPDGVPLFHADPDHPDQLVRVYKGNRVRGRFVNGKFRKIANR